MRTLAFPHACACVVLVVASMAGCATRPDAPAPLFPPDAKLPPWNGALAKEFEDSFEPQWLQARSATSPDADLWFGPRAQSADYVLRVRVVSTTTLGIGPSQGYLLTLQAVGEPLAGPKPPTDIIEVVIRADNEMFASVRMHDIRLTTRTFTAFLKGFSAGKAQKVHWYLAGDNPESIAAIRRARTLADVGYRIPTPRL